MAVQPQPQVTARNIPIYRRLDPTPAKQPGATEKHRVVIVGAGPVGLAMAIDMGQRGHDVLLLGKYDFIAAGSKAICFSKRSLDILHRLGVGEEAVERGVTWNLGKVFWKDSRDPIYQFDLAAVKDQKMPAFINIQQYLLEEMLIERMKALPNIDFRTGHEVTAIDPDEEGVILSITAGEDDYSVAAEWLIACDGCNSFIRKQMGLEFEGRVFEDNFLIADVRMEHEQAVERWFWFDPPFNPGRSALMHKQPDGVWRLDFQLGWGIDREQALKPENVENYVRAMLGDDVKFSEEWYSIYTFQCRRMDRFAHGRVLFAGDSAHLVSPFGARGCNGGFADIDNLSWKLDLILKEEAGPALLETYNHEAVVTADANIEASTRSADFLTPKSKISETFRNAVLELANTVSFARQFVNSGRLSVAIAYPDGPLDTADEDDWLGLGVPPGHVALDAPLADGWLLDRLGAGFMLLTDDANISSEGVDTLEIPGDAEVLRERFALEDGTAYLIRPDQYVAARWKRPTPEKIAAALAKAKGGAA